MPETENSPQKSVLEKFSPVLIIACLILAFVAGSLWQKVKLLEGGNSATVRPAPTRRPVTIDEVKSLLKENVIKFESEGAKVTFVEFADPSCPFCHVASGKNPSLNAQMDPTTNRFKLVSEGGTYKAPESEMKKLLDQGKANFIYIYTPGHGNGEMGTKALYCAYDKNKYWQVHDLLMTQKGYDLLNNVVKNDKTKSQELINFLKSAIKPSDLKACLEDSKYDDRLKSDVALASKFGVSGTPAFYLNENFVAGADNWTNMEPLISDLLK